jgi:hypothetical protein
MSFQLAQVNIARAKAPLDSPLMADFMSALDKVNALADSSPGFVWRLQTSDGNATAVRAYDDPLIIFNMSVWESVAALRNYVYRTMHGEVFARRQSWFEKLDTPHMAMWWIPKGCLPDVAEAKKRLEFLTRNGETSHAFTFRKIYEPDPTAL